MLNHALLPSQDEPPRRNMGQSVAVSPSARTFAGSLRKVVDTGHCGGVTCLVSCLVEGDDDPLAFACAWWLAGGAAAGPSAAGSTRRCASRLKGRGVPGELSEVKSMPHVVHVGFRGC